MKKRNAFRLNLPLYKVEMRGLIHVVGAQLALIPDPTQQNVSNLGAKPSAKAWSNSRFP